MNTSSSDLRSLPHLRAGARDASRGIEDTKSAPGAPAAGENVETADPTDRAAFGEFLRQARERRQMTLQQIADDTKISSRHLNALEQGNVKSLPTGMYRRAMLRAYAESVGLDKESAIEQFERTFEPRARTEPVPAPPPAAAGRPRVAGSTRTREMRVMLVVVVVAATALVGLITGDPAAPTPPTVASTSPAADTPSPSPDPGVDAPNPAATAPAPERITSAAPAQAVVPAAALPAPQPVVPARAEIESGVARATTGREAAVEPRPAPVRASAGELVIVTAPEGARVTVNGTGWGVTPVTVRHLPFGSKRVRITREGYVSQERVINVAPDRPTATLRVTLEPQN